MCWQKPSPLWWQKWSLSLITDCNYSHILMQAPTKVAKSTWISPLYREIQQKRLLHMKMFTRWHSSFAYINRKLGEQFVANWTSVGISSTLKFDFRACVSFQHSTGLFFHLFPLFPSLLDFAEQWCIFSHFLTCRFRTLCTLRWAASWKFRCSWNIESSSLFLYIQYPPLSLSHLCINPPFYTWTIRRNL